MMDVVDAEADADERVGIEGDGEEVLHLGEVLDDVGQFTGLGDGFE